MSLGGIYEAGAVGPDAVDYLNWRGWGLCQYCWSAQADTIDHIVPQVGGGTDCRCGRGGGCACNLVPACRSCNSSKGGRTPGFWPQELARSRGALTAPDSPPSADELRSAGVRHPLGPWAMYATWMAKLDRAGWHPIPLVGQMQYHRGIPVGEFAWRNLA